MHVDMGFGAGTLFIVVNRICLQLRDEGSSPKLATDKQNVLTTPPRHCGISNCDRRRFYATPIPAWVPLIGALG